MKFHFFRKSDFFEKKILGMERSGSGERRVGPSGWEVVWVGAVQVRMVRIWVSGRRVAQKFRAFFSSPAPMFSLFFSLRGSSRGFVAAGRGHGPPKLRVWVLLGAPCASPSGPKGRWGFTNRREDRPRVKKRENMERERKN